MKNEKEQIRQYYESITVPDSTIEKLRALEAAETPAADRKRRSGVYFRFALAAAMFAVVCAVGIGFLKDGYLPSGNLVPITETVQTATEETLYEPSSSVSAETGLHTGTEPTRPIQPTQPSDPPEPTQPAESAPQTSGQQLPTRPAETGPSSPAVGPTEPTEPIVSAEPTEPTEPAEPVPNMPMDPITLTEPLTVPQPFPIDYSYYSEYGRSFIRITRLTTAEDGGEAAPLETVTKDVTDEIIDDLYEGVIEAFAYRWHVELKLFPEGEHQLCITALNPKRE